jgi:hypothetical protein
MDPPFFQEIGASDKLWTNLSLSVQLGWFEQLKPSLCSSPKSLFTLFSSLSVRFCIWDSPVQLVFVNKKERKFSDKKTAGLI